MAENVKVIAPRIPTSGTGLPSGPRMTGHQGDDLFAEQVRQLALFAAMAGGLWMFGLLMEFVFLPAVPTTFVPSRVTTSVEVLALTAAIAMFVYARRAPNAAGHASTVAILFMLVNAFAVAILNTWMVVPFKVPAMHVSWNAVTILVFSMVAPATPRRMLAASLVAASLDPLFAWIAYYRGAGIGSALSVLVFYLPNYACAAVATLPAHVFQRLGRRLRQAQDLGSYHLVELLGSGGMGEVWRAEHRLLARNAAIKLVRPEVLGAGSEADAKLILRRFEREAKATAALNSPHTIDVFDFGITHDGCFYYVMELLHGRDLESLVRDFGPVPADRAIFLLRQVCHSLAEAHARGLVHRDIKPANIYLCRMGLEYDFVKVLDFGLVKFKDRAAMQSTLMTVDHRMTGTPAYMAPEIILGESDVDRRADVYALGCVAYYLLTGQLVFEADSPMKMLMQHVQAEPVPPSQRTELPVPRELDDIVLACLQKDPDKRPQNAEELLRIAHTCHSCDTWNQDTASRWWEKHLTEFTGPLTLTASYAANVPASTPASVL